MKKKLLVILFLLLFPSMVLAKDTCNNNDIKIEEVTILEKEGYIEELTPVSIDNNKINLNLEMYKVGESITYKIKIKNNSNNDYYFTKDSFNLNTDYIEYSLLNDSEVIKANEEKEIELKIMYKKQIPNGEFNENNMMSITLSDTPLSNPSTKRTIFLVLLVTLITLIVFAINRNKKLNKVLIGILICSIPLSIKALCTVNLEINVNITINEKKAIFLPGKEVNVKMKELAGDDTSTNSQPYNFLDKNITAIKYSNQEPNESEKQEKNIVSTIDSPYPIYMWYEEGTIYWWSEVKRPKLNEDASYMFNRMTKLNNISSLEYFDTSTTKNMEAMLCQIYDLNNIDPLKSWNVSNVINMAGLFRYCGKLSSLDPIKDWNVSNVVSLGTFLEEDFMITSLEPLQNWNTSNVSLLFSSFASTGITNLKGLENWDVSNVTDLSWTFSGCRSLTSISSLKNWNVSNVTDMTYTFQKTSLTNLEGLEDWSTTNLKSLLGAFAEIGTLTSIEALSNWDTSNVNNLNRTFKKTSISNLDSLRSWNVLNVTSYIESFMEITTLEDASAINNWDIQKTANFASMFRYMTIHPEFTKVSGTWNSAGTFTPNP